MGSLSPIQKRKDADALLAWLKENELENWPNSYAIFLRASEELGIELFNLWKCYELLRTMGRIELNSPNGRRGTRVLSFAPLAEAIPENALLCSRDNCPLLKRLDQIFQQ